ncbi:hypothetical protein CBR_g38750 [Chara braunii]|uniref:Core Histone H2A/H2B/H3 domain-containing protein n=1 Tax=Chara braunii TaxID=69332 RepID=A0A388LQ59_CHABU|nr:hypothetical protein CBR_g38750 [Chara braunii]|eukprot:GBG84466.1 hypothetical protein CBR_g38750 [Chara braunii]
METEDILKGFADGSKEGNSAGGNTADCAEVLATIYAQTAEIMGDGDETENGAGGSTCETEKVGEEREEGGLGSKESQTGCIVKDENVVKTSAGEEYPYDINWVSGRVQPGIVGGAPCFSSKVDETWGEFRLNDFLYDSFDCEQSWVIGGNDATGSTACHETDARRDPRLGWVPCAIPIPCGRMRMMMRDAMGNVMSTHYVNGNFSFRNLDREVSEDEKKAMACPTHTAGCFFPPLRNPMELEVVEGKVFSAQGDMSGLSDVAMSQSPGKMKKCTSGPPCGQTPAGRKKVNPKAVPATGDTACAQTQVSRRRRRPGMATLAEIRKFQRSTDLGLAFGPFLRLVRKVVEENIAPGMGVRFQMTAVRALMEAAEAYLAVNFENTNEVAIHSKRVTIQVKDMRLVDRLSKPRSVEKYQGMLDEKARVEERQQWIEARQAERDGSRAGSKKRKAVPREGGAQKKRQLENSIVCVA